MHSGAQVSTGRVIQRVADADLTCEPAGGGKLKLDLPVSRFACTQCGKCCNRSPEVELSEAASLADTFVFRLMFRFYWLPEKLSDYLSLSRPEADASAIFFEKKRLLRAFAARRYPMRLWRSGKSVDYAKYLVISALALDTGSGECDALRDNRCGVYDRRPLSCRSVPLHYSRAGSRAATDLKAFVATGGYRCDTSDAAPAILDNGQIIALEIKAARDEALAVAQRDRPWSQAIVRRMKSGSSADGVLPSLEEVEANAQAGALTTSMRVGWRIAADAALIPPQDCDRLVEVQLRTIVRALAHPTCSPEARQTLIEMQAEYRPFCP